MTGPGAPDPASAVDADSARDLAVAWQEWAGQRSLSTGELIEWQSVFEALGERFGLIEEFRENGIC